MQSGKIQFGVLGVARINRKVIPAIQRSPFAQVAAIASRTIEKARASSIEHGIAKAYGSYEEILADPTLDAVYIPLPNSMHLEWVKKAAEAKKHVLCEKPLGLTAHEVREAIETCKTHKLFLMDGFMWPHHPRTKAIKEILDSRLLGEIRHINSSFTFLLERSKPDIRRTQPMGGGALYDIGCYCVRSLLFTLGAEPVAVSATATWEDGIDWEMTAILEFPNHVTASVHFGFYTPFHSTWEIRGTEKTLSVPFPWNPEEITTLEIWNGAKLEEKRHFEKSNHIFEMIDCFSKSILTSQNYLPNLDTALSLAKTIDALYESARTKKRVVL